MFALIEVYSILAFLFFVYYLLTRG